MVTKVLVAKEYSNSRCSLGTAQFLLEKHEQTALEIPNLAILYVKYIENYS